MPMPSETTMQGTNSGHDSDKRRAQMIQLARTIEQRADQPLTLASLAEEVGLSPSRLQKVFKDVLGVSPKTYQDAARMRQFKQSLRQGSGVTDAIFESGYGSVSRVYGEGKRSMGMTPTAYRAGAEGERISYAYRNTSLGLVMMAATDQGVCFVQFDDTADSLLDALQREFPKADLSASSAQHAPELDQWIEALDRHIDNAAPKPDIPLDIRGTAFQVKVWNFLQTIPEGSVLSYSDVANGIGKPKATRAVGTACGKNRIGLLVPCHRVLRGDGQLGGYRWGLERKQALLAMESQRNPQPTDQAQ
ncbi:methylated-DNA--[protein]-cysteine S-methyltransferase [Marinobacter sp.]|uniref:bifunctional transcriptional activator/DNA repair enzyme AdaA n=1 Tax=Marinobacter sp. TaxID=50741 RepID=UPI002354EBE9|nr:methylated-DNA--[protein]-cysteine S-methyltransferase [Marinobacter sp.]